MSKAKTTNPLIFGQEKNIELLELAAKTGKSILLIGDTGTGKTSAVQQVAKSKGKKCVRINLNGQSGTDEILGKTLLKDGNTYWVDGPLVKAAREGSWVLLDEVNAATPEVLFSLHALLDDDRKISLVEKDGEEVIPHVDFRFFASMNDSTYAGTKDMNSAFMSRFPIVTKWTYPSEPVETEILTARTKITVDTAARLVALASVLRSRFKAGQISYICSTRDLLSCGELMEHGNTLLDAFTCTILNRALDAEERAVIMKEFTNVTGLKLPVTEHVSVIGIMQENEALKKENFKINDQLEKITDLVSQAINKDPACKQ